VLLRQTGLVPTEDAWAAVAERFVEGHYGTLRGRVRNHVIACHLRDHLPEPPAALVDVGGGAGNQSIPLARDGYQVTIVDPSAAMLARARARLAAEPAEMASRVQLIQASVTEAHQALGGRRFAAELCHGVIMYVDDPRRGALIWGGRWSLGCSSSDRRGSRALEVEAPGTSVVRRAC
jgi:2-polyprenyl-3-methyl-5-hydroxy-6-metoxy-1,4-benzoquinol methylase